MNLILGEPRRLCQDARLIRACRRAGVVIIDIARIDYVRAVEVLPRAL